MPVFIRVSYQKYCKLKNTKNITSVELHNIVYAYDSTARRGYGTLVRTDDEFSNHTANYWLSCAIGLSIWFSDDE
jgi:hypothetical protein